MKSEQPRSYGTTVVLLVLVLYLIMTVFATYPLVKQLDRSAPFDLGDPLFMSWLVSWNDGFFLSRNLSLSNLFDTNIYYPYKNTLAYSDLMLVPSLLVLPVYYLTGNPLITVNVLLIFLLAGTGLAMFLLARYLTGNSLAGFIAGGLYVFSAYHQAQIGHIQLHTDLFLLLMLSALHLWLDSQKPVFLLSAFAMLVLEALSSWYYAIYGAVLMAVFLIHFFVWRRLKIDKKTLATFFIGATFSALLIFPFVRPYLELHRSMPNFQRTVGETAVFAADPIDYLTTVPQNLVWGRWLGLSKPGVEDILFPGLAVIILAIVGIKRGGKAASGSFDSGDTILNSDQSPVRSMKTDGRDRSVKLFYLTVAGIGFILSFGPYKTIFGHTIPLPFILPFELFPGFKAMRVPSRFALLVVLGLSVLAAFGLDYLIKFWKERRRNSPAADGLAVLVLAFIVIQQISWPIPLSQPVASGNRIPGIYKWLARYNGSDVILELPPAQSEQTKYVYYSAYHSKRLVNGYSGYTPPLWTELEAQTADFPSADSIVYLRQLGVNGILVHSSMIPDWQERSTTSRLKSLKLVKRVDKDYFFVLRAPSKQAPILPAALNKN